MRTEYPVAVFGRMDYGMVEDQDAFEQRRAAETHPTTDDAVLERDSERKLGWVDHESVLSCIVRSSSRRRQETPLL